MFDAVEKLKVKQHSSSITSEQMPKLGTDGNDFSHNNISNNKVFFEGAPPVNG